MNSQAFNISLPKELVKKIDELAKREYTSRSDYIRSILVRQVNEAEEWNNLLDSSNAKGRNLGILSEQQVYDMVAEAETEFTRKSKKQR